MTRLRNSRLAIAAVLAVTLIAGVVLAVQTIAHAGRNQIVGYFENSNALFPGDDVRILGVPVGQVEKVEPQPDGVKVTFWFDHKYKVPADVKAAILSPMLVTGRAIQLTPAYTGGPTLKDGAVIPRKRTAVPVEWDEVRSQLKRLTDMLKPTSPGGVSTMGDLINTAADNLRGQGGNIRDTIIKLSQAMSILGDHSGDIFATFRNLSILVTALRGSSHGGPLHMLAHTAAGNLGVAHGHAAKRQHHLGVFNDLGPGDIATGHILHPAQNMRHEHHG